MTITKHSDDSIITAPDDDPNARRPTDYDTNYDIDDPPQVRRTDLQCSYMLYTSLHGQQSHHMPLGHRGKGGRTGSGLSAVKCFPFLSTVQLALSDACDVACDCKGNCPNDCIHYCSRGFAAFTIKTTRPNFSAHKNGRPSCIWHWRQPSE